MSEAIGPASFLPAPARNLLAVGRGAGVRVPSAPPRAWLAELPAMDLFAALLFQVTGQQLSVAATRRILARIEDLSSGHLPMPAQLLDLEPATLTEAARPGGRSARSATWRNGSPTAGLTPTG
jgi:hypothetical protein